MAADDAFEAVAGYLHEAGWYQDGDDPGLWVKDARHQVSIGTALEMQLGHDRFSAWIVERVS